MDGGGDTFNNKPLSVGAADAIAVVDNSSSSVKEDDNNKKELAKRNCSSLPLCYDRVSTYFIFLSTIFFVCLVEIYTQIYFQPDTTNTLQKKYCTRNRFALTNRLKGSFIRLFVGFSGLANKHAKPVE